MPFITQDRRKLLDNGMYGQYDLSPGDRCYLQYKRMVEKWRENPRWTTAHEIYKDVMTTIYGIHLTNLDDVTAKHLAWQVFFAEHVMPYEHQKQDQNGDI